MLGSHGYLFLLLCGLDSLSWLHPHRDQTLYCMLQRHAIHLYRRVLREAQRKEGAERDMMKAHARGEFEKYANIFSANLSLEELAEMKVEML